MARITEAYIRRQYLVQFARMSPERREGTIESLTVLHETVLPGKPEEAAEIEPDLPPTLPLGPEPEEVVPTT